MILLKDGTIVTSELVTAETECTFCGAQPSNPCIGRRGPRVSCHTQRWGLWCKTNNSKVAQMTGSHYT